MPFFRLYQSLLNQHNEAVDRVLTVLFLCSETPRGNDQNPVAGNSTTGKPREAFARFAGQGCGVAYVKSQLRRG